jgi:hypothetical protein
LAATGVSSKAKDAAIAVSRLILENIVLESKGGGKPVAIVRNKIIRDKETESNERCIEEMERDVVVCDTPIMRG